MRRLIFTGLVALVISPATFAADPGSAAAVGAIAPAGVAPAAGGGYGTAYASDGLGFINKRPFPIGMSPFGVFGFGFRMYPGLMQHGPLVNYGPYFGYYPFEPYGPWNSNIQYTGPMEAPGAQQWNAEYGRLGLFNRERERRYALDTLRNVGLRVNPFHRGACSTCQ